MRFILCECGEFIEDHIFKDYIKTSSNPSTPTIGHESCGLIFNFIDDCLPKKYSSKTELKSIALKLAEKKNLDIETIGHFLLEVDRIKSIGELSDGEILMSALKKAIEKVKIELDFLES